MNILNIEEILVCIYNNINLQGKYKLSLLSSWHKKTIQFFHKQHKTVKHHRIPYVNMCTSYHDACYLYYHNDKKYETVCINSDIFKVDIISDVGFNDTFSQCYIDDGILIYEKNLKLIKIYPKYEEYTLIEINDNMYIDNVKYYNQKIYVQKRRSTRRKSYHRLEIYRLLNNKLELINFIDFGTEHYGLDGGDLYCFLFNYYFTQFI